MSDAPLLWVYLAREPLTWLALTLIVYVAADWLSARSGRHPLVNPVAIAIAAMVAILKLTGTDFRTYFEGAQFIHFMLGPATVALAVPLVRHWREIRRDLAAISAALAAGTLTALASTVLLARGFGLDASLVASLAPKSVTTPIAMGISEKLGGVAAVSAVCVIATGIIGATMGLPLLRALRINDRAAQGFALGLSAHGIGTARAFQRDSLTGTFSGIGMALAGLVAAFAAPAVYYLLAG
ncbi:MAG: LrgB family protein [Flavobacteriaceae bacterium]